MPLGLPMPSGNAYHLGLLPHMQLYNKVFKLKTLYQKLWTSNLHMELEIQHHSSDWRGNKSITWTFAEIRQYATDYHDIEDGHKFMFMSNVHEDISVGENCVKTQMPIQNLSRLSRLNLLQICKAHKIQANQRMCLNEISGAYSQSQTLSHLLTWLYYIY